MYWIALEVKQIFKYDSKSLFSQLNFFLGKFCKLLVGDKVIRGPNWASQHKNEDCFLGNVGKVISILGNNVCVEWNNSMLDTTLSTIKERKTFNYVYDVESRVFEIVLADEEVGGLIYMKGLHLSTKFLFKLNINAFSF